MRKLSLLESVRSQSNLGTWEEQAVSSAFGAYEAPLVTCHMSLVTGLPMPLEAGFGEVDVVLDAAEDFVVDGVFVAQADDGFAFGIQGFAG